MRGIYNLKTSYTLTCFILGCFLFGSSSVMAAINCGTGYVAKTFAGILMPVDGACGAGQKQIDWPDMYIHVTRASSLRCGAGYYNNGTTCVARAKKVCTNGKYDFASGGILSPVDGSCGSGQKQVNWPAAQSDVTRASSLRCGAGYYNNGTKCVARAKKTCTDDKYDFASGGILSPIDGSCGSGQKQVNWPVVQSGVVRSASLRCGAGYYNNGTKCVAISKGDCPTSYYSGDRSDVWGVPDAENACAAGFGDYTDVEWCRYLGGNTDPVCSPLCPDGLTHTRGDTCANSCSVGGKTKLVLGGRITLPMWDTKTTRALAIQSGEEKCWVNLVPGQGTNALNVKDASGNIYHAVD